ncbi:MAG: hypothetical protein AB7O56_10930 [Bauldia sp.]
MSLRAFLVLVVATIAMTVAAVALVVSEQAAAVPPFESGETMFPALTARADDIGQIEVDTGRYSLQLARQDGDWVAVNRGGYPVRAEAVAEAIAAIAGLETIEPKTTDPTLFEHLALAGPDGNPPGPGFKVVARATDGAVLADVVIGMPSASVPYARRGGIFVRRSGETQAWLAEGDVFLPDFVQDWFEPLFAIPSTEVVRLSIYEGQTLVFDTAKPDPNTGDFVLYTLSPEYGPPNAEANDNGIRGVTQAIVSTTLEDARPIGDIAFPAAARTLVFVMRSGLQLDVRLGEIDGEPWLTYTASAAAGAPPEAVAQAQSITDRTSRWAFRLAANRMSAFARELTALFEVPPPPEVPAPAAPLVPGVIPR